MQLLDKNFWNNKYKNNQTGWDIGSASTPLVEYFTKIKNKNAKILIPGCGNAYEAEWLVNNGFDNIVLLDIADEGINNLQLKFIDNNSITILHQDFFEHIGNYDYIVEQTFFCAIHPSLRAKYVSKMYDLLCTNGKLIGLFFNCNFENNPPFGGSLEEYEQLFSTIFKYYKFSLCYNSIKPRQGNELFLIAQK